MAVEIRTVVKMKCDMKCDEFISYTKIHAHTDTQVCWNFVEKN